MNEFVPGQLHGCLKLQRMPGGDGDDSDDDDGQLVNHTEDKLE